MFKMYDVVQLNKPIPSTDLPKGSLGTVLIIHAANPAAYEVEFIDEQGQHIGVYTLADEDLEPADLSEKR
jgi:hypothetical protein